MATRDKKLAVARKQQTASPVPTKDTTMSTETSRTDSCAEEGTKATTKTAAARNTAQKAGAALSKKLAKKNTPAKSKKPTFTVKLKAKNKKPVQIKPKMVKAIIENSKEPDKKKLLKNGVKAVRTKKTKASKPTKREQTVVADDDDKPPVLEPIYPLEDNGSVEKKSPKKKVTKKVSQGNLDTFVRKTNPEQKMKSENDDAMSVASDVTDTSVTETPKSKKRVQKKIKVEKIDVSIEPMPEPPELAGDLSTLVKKEEDIKQEPEDPVDLLPKPDIAKVKRPSKKKIDLKSKAIKKENIENTLSKLDQAQCQTIDGLDLNVGDLKKAVPMKARRHSIEKFPLEPVTADTQLSVLRNLPPCLSPRTKRSSKVRQSLEGPMRKSSPYMRSDSPARILRNGKHRKLKDINLLEGIKISKKRKRLCSDLSGTESASKFSGYDSDSSYSDLSSIHGAETPDCKDTENICGNSLDSLMNKEPFSVGLSAKPVSYVKKAEVVAGVTDTNSNVYEHPDQAAESKEVKKASSPFFKPDSAETASSKVPDKSLILDIMKAAFNDIPEDSEKDKKASQVTQDRKEETEDLTKCDSEIKCDEKENFSSTFECFGPIKELKDDDREDIPLISPITPTTKEMEKSDDLKLDEIISKLEEAMDTEEVTTPPQSTDVTLISNDIISTPIYPDTMRTLALPLSMLPAETQKPTEDAETEKPNQIQVQVEIHKEPESNNAITDTEMCVDEQTVEEPMPEEDVQEKDSKEDEIAVVEDSEPVAVPSEILEGEEKAEEKAEPLDIQNGASSSISKEPTEVVEESEIKTCEQNDAVQPSDVNNISELGSDISSEKDQPMSSKEKEDIMNALGLQTWKAAEEARQKLKEKEKDKDSEKDKSQEKDKDKEREKEKEKDKVKDKYKEKNIPKNEEYTGTLKTVIKLNRDSNKKKKHSLKMTVKHKSKKTAEVELPENDDSRLPRELQGPSTSGWKHGGQSSDTAGAQRKSHYSNRSNPDGSSEHTSDGEGAAPEEAAAKTLVIPEKASSFSIHPGRVCKDECSYCYGKFGLFDTPCHVAQIKSVERQDKVLSLETNLTHESCLCDACFRHIDRRANTPSYVNRSYTRSALATHVDNPDCCQVVGCKNVSNHMVRRKWLMKIKRNVVQVVNIDLDNPGVHSISFCNEHFIELEKVTICALCKRRLARNHIHYLGPETVDVNAALVSSDIAITLVDRPILCKLCKCFSSVILKPPEERSQNMSCFFTEYKKRLLHFNQIVLMDKALAEEPLSAPFKDKSDKVKEPPRKKRKVDRSHSSEPPHLEPEVDLEKSDQHRVPSSDSSSQKSQSRPESPSDYMVDVNNLVPAIALECGSDGESGGGGGRRDPPKQHTIVLRKIPRPESVKEAVAISKRFKSDKQSSDIAVQRLGSNPSISVRQLFPGEEDLPLSGSIEFGNVKEKTPEGWEKCTSTIQYDSETRQLWQELQKPYGNQSSFLRHMVLLEKYFRNGDLILSPKASHQSINYAESVQNRLKAYDNIPSNAGHVQPLSMIPFNKPQRSSSGIITSGGTSVLKEPLLRTSLPCATLTALPKNTPLTLTQLNSIPSTSATTLLKTTKAPPPTVPGLIQLQPGTTRPVAPQLKPQTQKIKFPITKNWRPTLIPIDPAQKGTERKPGLVQVVSGGVQYHITIEDYKKMCAIKRNFEAKQKLQESHGSNKAVTVTTNSVLKRIVPGKGLVISKTGPGRESGQKAEQVPMATLEPVDCENSLEKLDRQVEKLEAKFNETKVSPMTLPKIPKSLTVIPQTVVRRPPSRPESPSILITPKPKQFPKS